MPGLLLCSSADTPSILHTFSRTHISDLNTPPPMCTEMIHVAHPCTAPVHTRGGCSLPRECQVTGFWTQQAPNQGFKCTLPHQHGGWCHTLVPLILVATSCRGPTSKLSLPSNPSRPPSQLVTRTYEFSLPNHQLVHPPYPVHTLPPWGREP